MLWFALYQLSLHKKMPGVGTRFYGSGAVKKLYKNMYALQMQQHHMVDT